MSPDFAASDQNAAPGNAPVNEHNTKIMKTDKTTKSKNGKATASSAVKVAPKKIVKTAADEPAVRTAQPAGVPASTSIRTVASTVARNASTTTPRREITTELIAARAYTLWEQQGRPQGNEVQNWLLAESQLKQEIQSFTA